MPNRKQEKRRRKLRVHGPSSDAVGAPPTGRKEPRPTATPARGAKGGRREPPVPSLKRSARKAAFFSIFMFAVIIVTTRDRGTTSIIIGIIEVIALSIAFTAFDLWMARKIYKRMTGHEAPRAERLELRRSARPAEEPGDPE